MRGASITWIKLSGLPQLITTSCGSAGWILFMEIIATDSDRNTDPGRIDLSVQDLTLRTGLQAAPIRKALKALNKLKLIKMFLPESDEELALFEVGDLTSHAPAQPETGAARRYLETTAAEAPLNTRQLVVDMYLNQCGTRWNVFISDKLSHLASTYPLETIRRGFWTAQKAEIRSLDAIIRIIAKPGPKDKRITLNQPFTVGDDKP